VTTPACLLSSRRVERHEGGTNEKEHFEKKTSGDGDDRLARRPAPLHPVIYAISVLDLKLVKWEKVEHTLEATTKSAVAS
jgi:hypothetical protein